MLRIEAADARRPDAPYGHTGTGTCDATAALASLTPAQQAAVASFSDAAGPWLDLGLADGDAVSAGDSERGGMTMLRIEAADARRPDAPYGHTGTDTCDAAAALASLTVAQQAAVASFSDAAGPWLDLGLADGEAVSGGDLACVLEIVEDGRRLERHRDRSALFA